MPNPFGITEVSLPGIYGAVNENRMSRIQQMVGQRQLEALERQADRDQEEQLTIARITGRGAGKPMGGAYSTSQPEQPTGVGQQVANGIMGAVGVQPAQPATQPQGVLRLTPDQLFELRQAGPRGEALAQAYQSMDEQQRALTSRRAQAGGQVAQALRRIPDPAQRAAAFQQNAQLLLAQGFTPEELQQYAQAGFSDQVLDSHIRDADIAARFTRMGQPDVTLGPGDVRRDANGQEIARGLPRYYAVTEGGDVRPAPSDVTSSPVNYRDGETRVINGVTYRREGGAWHPQGNAAPTGSSDLDNWNNAGGGSQGPRTFR